MSLLTDTPIDALTAPDADGDILVWPDARTLPARVEANRRLFSGAEAMLVDRTLREWRRISRGDESVILAGHQPEFIHPGVWAKHPAVVALARLVGARAQYLLVDSDVPLRFGLAWPEQIGGRFRRGWASPGVGGSGASFERFRPLSGGAWRQFLGQVPNGGESSFKDFADAFATERPTDYVDRWIIGITAVERAAGAESPQFVRVSEVFGGRGAFGADVTAFIVHLLLNARRFAAEYNAALARYRARRGMAGNQHPIPDLNESPESVELPFWVVGRDQPRRRLFVSTSSAGALTLMAADEVIVELDVTRLRRDAATLAGLLPEGIGLRPRALALTLYARLLACDLFIHGIGGAKYDQITDDIIRGFFGMAAPAYACVTATLRLPLARHAVCAGDVRAARRRLRDIRYNPQRFLDGKDAALFKELLDERQFAIREAESLRTSAPLDRMARRSQFERIRAANEALLAALPGVESGLRQEAARLNEMLENNVISSSREWFVALHAPSRLRGLAERVASAVR